MIIVSGRVLVAPEHVEAFLSACRDAIVQARRTPACLDFVVAVNSLDPDKINVYERWERVARSRRSAVTVPVRTLQR